MSLLCYFSITITKKKRRGRGKVRHTHTLTTAITVRSFFLLALLVLVISKNEIDSTQLPQETKKKLELPEEQDYVQGGKKEGKNSRRKKK